MFGRIKRLGIQQPTLHAKVIAFPFDAFRLTPLETMAVVGMRDLLPGASASGPDFGRVCPGISNHGAGVDVAREYDRLRAFPDLLHTAGRQVESGDGHY